MMNKISESVKIFLNGQKLGYVATVSENGTPNLSPKGTIIAWGERHSGICRYSFSKHHEKFRNKS